MPPMGASSRSTRIGCMLGIAAMISACQGETYGNVVCSTLRIETK